MARAATTAGNIRMSYAPFRGRMVGTRHMVSAGHYLATNAAFQVLEAGGNAIDAAIAASAFLEAVKALNSVDLPTF